MSLFKLHLLSSTSVQCHTATYNHLRRPTINGKTLGSDEQEGPDLEDVLDSDEQMADVTTHISQMVVVGFQVGFGRGGGEKGKVG